MHAGKDGREAVAPPCVKKYGTPPFHLRPFHIKVAHPRTICLVESPPRCRRHRARYQARLLLHWQYSNQCQMCWPSWLRDMLLGVKDSLLESKALFQKRTPSSATETGNRPVAPAPWLGRRSGGTVGLGGETQAQGKE